MNMINQSVHQALPRCVRTLGAWLIASLVSVLSLQALAQGTPAQQPLISREGAGVKPNIVLTMDDSGSMKFQFMPDAIGTVANVSYNNLANANAYPVMTPQDPEWFSAYTNQNPVDRTVVATDVTSDGWVARMRSASSNSVYYNPAIRYQPWLNADGTSMPNATPTAVWYSPLTSANGTVNLTVDVNNQSYRWCRIRSSNTVSCQTESRTDQRAVFFVYDGSGDITNASNYTRYKLSGTASHASFPKGAARVDCAGTTCTLTEERQNYANWFMYYRSRILLSKGAVAKSFIEGGENFRLGYGRINKTTQTSIDGANTRTLESGVRDFGATQRSAMVTWLYNMDPSGGTPLRRAVQDVGEYYSRTDNRGPWTDNPATTNTVSGNKTCRRAYNMLVTDGYWNDSTGSGGLTAVGNQDNNAGPVITGTARSYQYQPVRPYSDGNSDRLADYAMKYWKNDIQPNMANEVVPSGDNPAFWQHMVNFTVGLGVNGTLNPDADLPALTQPVTQSGAKSWGTDQIDDLWHSALNTRGDFFSAKDPAELSAAIRSAIGATQERELREAGVATAATVLEDGNRKYIPLYRTGSWSGNIQALQLDANGQAGAEVWNAANKLPAWGSRRIFTWDTGLTTPQAVSFTWAAMSASNRTALGSVGTAYTSTFVDFLRGDRSREGTALPFRERTGVLGDVINSNPVFVKGSVDMGYTTLPTIGSSYGTFLTAKAARQGALFVGANDGMLHAYRDTNGATPAQDGQEIFAFVPRAVYPTLAELASKTYGTSALPHRYFVDGPLKESDVYVPPPSGGAAAWRNYLLGSLGAGGRAVFALDVTDTSSLGASSVRWEIANDADLGYVTTPIQTGVLPNGEWVAIFGNGPGSTNGNAVLFVVQISTGTVTKLQAGTTSSNSLGGVAVKRNGLGQIEAVYAGDLKGKLWKFEYSASAASRFAVSGNTPLFSATNAAGTVEQPITQAPALYTHSQGGTLLVFGSGVLSTLADATNTSVQSVYGLWDKASDTFARPMGRGSLATRTLSSFSGTGNAANDTFYSISGTAVDWTTQRGWVMDLGIIPGLRVVYPPQNVSFELVLISAVAPAQNVTECSTSTGVGVNLVFMVENGSNPPYKLFDTNGDSAFNSTDASSAGYKTNADGIDSLVYSPNRRGSNSVADGPCPAGFYRVSIQNTSGQTMTCVRRETTGSATIQDRIWRRILNPPIR